MHRHFLVVCPIWPFHKQGSGVERSKYLSVHVSVFKSSGTHTLSGTLQLASTDLQSRLIYNCNVWNLIQGKFSTRPWRKGANSCRGAYQWSPKVHIRTKFDGRPGERFKTMVLIWSSGKHSWQWRPELQRNLSCSDRDSLHENCMPLFHQDRIISLCAWD